jgi:hypothetical protein
MNYLAVSRADKLILFFNKGIKQFDITIDAKGVNHGT